jgi:hypothetical protein
MSSVGSWRGRTALRGLLSTPARSGWGMAAAPWRSSRLGSTGSSRARSVVARLDGAPSVVVGAEAAHGDGSGGVAEDDITMQLWLGVVGDGAAERCQGP